MRADLEPTSQQLVVGGVGSGKTTQLLLARKWLEEQGKTRSFYIDITRETDLAQLNSGALVASFGLHLAASTEVDDDFDVLIRQFAYGKFEWKLVSLKKRDPNWMFRNVPLGEIEQTVPGKLQPFPSIERDLADILGPLGKKIDQAKADGRDIVIFFDGLDRLVPERFWAVVEQDFRALKQLGVSVVASAPIAVLYGAGKSVADHFDRVHHIPAVRVEDAKEVLRHRGGSDVISQANRSALAKASGGILRDLVSLARDAGEEAYLDGGETIALRHVKVAINQLGQSYLRGLSKVQIQILKKPQEFNPSTDFGFELLATRRIVEYSATDFRVHPALEPLLP